MFAIGRRIESKMLAIFKHPGLRRFIFGSAAFWPHLAIFSGFWPEFWPNRQYWWALSLFRPHIFHVCEQIILNFRFMNIATGACDWAHCVCNHSNVHMWEIRSIALYTIVFHIKKKENEEIVHACLEHGVVRLSYPPLTLILDANSFVFQAYILTSISTNTFSPEKLEQSAGLVSHCCISINILLKSNFGAHILFHFFVLLLTGWTNKTKMF